MAEHLPIVMFIVEGSPVGLVDRCERCGDELVAGEVWVVRATDNVTHQLEWVCCAECFGDLAQTWYSKGDRPAGAHGSSPMQAGPGIEDHP